MLQAIMEGWANGSGWATLVCIIGFIILCIGVALVVRGISKVCDWETSEQKKVREIPTVVRRYSPDGHMLKPDLSGKDSPPFWRYR